MKQNKQSLTIKILKMIERRINLKVFRLVLIMLSLATLVSWIILAKKPDYSEAVYIFGIVILLCFFVSLFLKYEINRLAYAVALGVIVIFSLITSFSYITNYRNQNELRQGIIAETQTSINNYQNDQIVSSSERAFTIEELKNNETSQLSKLTKKNSLLPILGCYLLVVGLIYYAGKFELIVRASELQSVDALDTDLLETASY